MLTLVADEFVARAALPTVTMLDEISCEALADSPTLRETSVAPRAASDTLRDISLAALATSAIDRAMSPTPLLASPTLVEIVCAAWICF